ncbi:serine hydrolase domain-containing protein [Flavobacterium selenitireducens]|uniref:serine hydrolase domain-containing protein n=1 Tax=Flavobacterium selenitireducens TaxID=2722704 RepID=UPI00168A8648|nr:serine hydrolase [Flavobacterium selenitireducens]MBD3582570.1 serine hydrolase [Flavobacterium selenitireducens]
MKNLIVATIIFVLLACDKNEDQNPPSQNAYFPPTSGSTWETTTPSQLGWNTSQIQPLLDFLDQKNSKSFLILVNGRIVIESYFNEHTAATPWYWASAGKTLTATAVGIAQQQGLLHLEDPVSTHLGSGWSSLTPQQENQITIRHLLTMTSGLDDQSHGECVLPECLEYSANAGTPWAYSNVYVLLQKIVAQASGQSWESFFNTNLKNKIGMSGTWMQMNALSVYFSTTRSMARFGLLALRQGEWQDQAVVPQGYMEQATSVSQNLNNAYGYLWWINGQENYHLPQTQLEFQGSLIPNGPSDMYMALGKNDQKIYVIPSRNMVVIRMGESAEGTNFTLSKFDDVLWQKINAVIN